MEKHTQKKSLKQPDLTSMLDSIHGPAVLIDGSYRIVATNEAYRKHYEVEGIDNSGRYCYEVSHRYSRPCDQAGETCPLKLTQSSGETQRVLHLHHTPRGEEHVDVEMHPIRNEKGKLIYFLETMRSSEIASSRSDGKNMIGRSSKFNQMLELIERVAPSESATLLLGESGTGKELVAKAIHDASERANGPFVPVECSGLTESLFESELFGHEKGAFTGAHNRKYGLVEAAKGGTLFLDEIGDVPLTLQVKLLRLLETSTFRRVGSTDPIKADFRLICATHRHLKQMVEDGSFRRDLYYRISVFPIDLPALKERRDDIALLSDSLLKRIAPARDITIDDEAMECLKNYSFPGNVRELRNLLERACLLADGDVIHKIHLPDICQEATSQSPFDFPEEIRPL
ncbi:MAG: sigma-54-dependent Fis family transcriptional regulator, partial [Gammaproteobacteria bacterium]|nr:sigma-54-dependent Fis family transcriptional regulator [Gammaproteobacteria bacterium]